MPPRYLTHPRFCSFLEEEQYRPGDVFPATIQACHIWYNILAIEFEQEHWARPHRQWDDSFRGYFPVTSTRLQVLYGPPYGDDPASLVVVTLQLLDDDNIRRHQKFEDDARTNVLDVIETDGRRQAQFGLVYAVVREYVVIFFKWTGWYRGRAELTKLVVRDGEDGKSYSGPLHVLDDADAVALMLEHIKETTKAEIEAAEVNLTAW
ncbi:hypothetical protein ABW21_db0206647 [Orbilia brochopaga]|nr:hypothetical protein ABW21_db0206647 [Drechslerella brochopaga]